jgi:predicted nicotinamide N-methyase
MCGVEIAGKRVLELGAGAGLTSMVMSLLGGIFDTHTLQEIKLRDIVLLIRIGVQYRAKNVYGLLAGEAIACLQQFLCGLQCDAHTPLLLLCVCM